MAIWRAVKTGLLTYSEAVRVDPGTLEEALAAAQILNEEEEAEIKRRQKQSG